MMDLTQTYTAFEDAIRAHKAVHDRIAALNCSTAHVFSAGDVPGVYVYAAESAEIVWLGFDEGAQESMCVYFDCPPEDQC